MLAFRLDLQYSPLTARTGVFVFLHTGSLVSRGAIRRSFLIRALPKSHFQHLLAMSEEELGRHGAVWQTVHKNPDFPAG